MNAGQNLRIKFEEETSGKCEEGEDVKYMHEKLGYWPENNKKQGNKCNSIRTYLLLYV